jgi:hypothetical protein
MLSHHLRQKKKSELKTSALMLSLILNLSHQRVQLLKSMLN